MLVIINMAIKLILKAVSNKTVVKAIEIGMSDFYLSQ